MHEVLNRAHNLQHETQGTLPTVNEPEFHFKSETVFFSALLQARQHSGGPQEGSPLDLFQM